MAGKIGLWIGLVLLIATALVGSYCVGGTPGVFTFSTVGAMFGLQCWIATRGTVRIDPHIVRGPPDGA